MGKCFHHIRRLFVVSTLVGGAVSPVTGAAQDRDLTKSAVDMVASVGCATKDDETWTLTQASEPISTGAPFSSREEIEEASGIPLGSGAYVLIGVADFLAPEELLDEFQRAEFTSVDSVNSTGALADGHRILVKGLFIENQRINLTSVIGLTERCG